MIYIASLSARSCAALYAERSVDGNHVDKGAACPQLNQSKLILTPLDGAAKYPAVKINHRRHIADAKDYVVNLADLDHAKKLSIAA